MEKLHLLVESEDSFSIGEPRSRRSIMSGSRVHGVSILAFCAGVLLFIISVTTNIALSLLLLRVPAGQNVAQSDYVEVPKDEYSSWLGLKHDHPRLWRHNTMFSSENVSESDTNWINMDIDYATVALSKEEVAQMNLPKAVEIPWAPNYFAYGVSPVHALHCLKYLHQSNLEYRHDIPQTFPVGHLLHCFDVIRAEVTCTFDDMPLALPLPTHGPNSQYRQCKDWSKLEKFAKEHAMCVSVQGVRKPGTTDIHPLPEVSRYCPPDSPLLPTIREYFQKPDGWIPPRAPPSLPKVSGVSWEGYDHERSAIDGL